MAAKTMLNFCDIVAAILKMVIGRNCSMSGHHYLPTYQILMKSDNVEFLLWSYRYMFLVGPKVFSFVVKGVKVIFLGVQRGWGLL
jgi:hypothetical protein